MSINARWCDLVESTECHRVQKASALAWSRKCNAARHTFHDHIPVVIHAIRKFRRAAGITRFNQSLWNWVQGSWSNCMWTLSSCNWILGNFCLVGSKSFWPLLRNIEATLTGRRLRRKRMSMLLLFNSPCLSLWCFGKQMRVRCAFEVLYSGAWSCRDCSPKHGDWRLPIINRVNFYSISSAMSERDVCHRKRKQFQYHGLLGFSSVHFAKSPRSTQKTNLHLLGLANQVCSAVTSYQSNLWSYSLTELARIPFWSLCGSNGSFCLLLGVKTYTSIAHAGEEIWWANGVVLLWVSSSKLHGHNDTSPFHALGH